MQFVVVHDGVVSIVATSPAPHSPVPSPLPAPGPPRFPLLFGRRRFRLHQFFDAGVQGGALFRLLLLLLLLFLLLTTLRPANVRRRRIGAGRVGDGRQRQAQGVEARRGRGRGRGQGGLLLPSASLLPLYRRGRESGGLGGGGGGGGLSIIQPIMFLNNRLV